MLCIAGGSWRKEDVGVDETDADAAATAAAGNAIGGGAGGGPPARFTPLFAYHVTLHWRQGRVLGLDLQRRLDHSKVYRQEPSFSRTSSRLEIHYSYHANPHLQKQQSRAFGLNLFEVGNFVVEGRAVVVARLAMASDGRVAAASEGEASEDLVGEIPYPAERC